MVNDIPTVMKASKNKVVLLRLRNNTTIQGILREFDIHMNLTLDDAQDITGDEPISLNNILLRGDNILALSLPNVKSTS